MFDNAIITRVGVDKRVDIGLLAETMFFYDSVHLVLDSSSIVALAKRIPSGELLALLRRPEIKLSYVQHGFGVVSAGQPRCHQFVAMNFAGTKPGRKKLPYKEEISYFLRREVGVSPEIKQLSRLLLDKVVLHRFKSFPEHEKIIPRLAQLDCSDKDFLTAAAATTLKHLLPSYVVPNDFAFELIDTGQGYAVYTNIDFSRLNPIYHQSVSPEHSSLSAEYLLAHIIDARSETYFASEYMGEVVTVPILSDIIRLKHFAFIQRREQSNTDLRLFEDVIVPEFPTIRETLNSKSRTLSEFLTLLDKADKFKEWLRTRNPDAGLIRSYQLSATEQTWADKLPSKSIRFAIATGLGILADAMMPSGLGTLAGVGVGGIDALYLDRIVKGWRPSQFITGPYREFVSPSEPITN
jgi:hypothetical protein